MFWRNIVSVFSGTLLSQLVPILASLAIARLYAPSEFGVFSAWLGVVLFMSVAITGRFETALAIESDGDPRRHAVFYTVVTSVIMAGLASVLIFGIVLTQEYIKLFVNIPTSMIFMTLPASLIVAIMQIWQSWAASEGEYTKLSLMRIAQAGSIAILQISFGMASNSAIGLMAGYFTGCLISVLFAVSLMPIKLRPFRKIKLEIIEFWSKFRRFPYFSLPADMINTAASQLPIIIIASRFGAETAGLLAMTMRMLGTPIGLLGKAVLDVFKRYAATSYRERGECRSDYLRTFKILLFGSLIFSTLMFSGGERLFALFFGEQWRGSGLFAVWLLPLFALGFIASPLSYMVYIAGKQHVDLIWQIALIFITLCALIFSPNYEVALKYYSAGYSFLYIIYIMMSYRFSLGDK